jgi:hypothetical protein
VVAKKGGAESSPGALVLRYDLEPLRGILYPLLERPGLEAKSDGRFSISSPGIRIDPRRFSPSPKRAAIFVTPTSTNLPKWQPKDPRENERNAFIAVQSSQTEVYLGTSRQWKPTESRSAYWLNLIMTALPAGKSGTASGN